MTPEELNRTIEFIIESQGRLAAAQERDREERLEFQTWSRGLSDQMSRLIVHQSQRMDRLDKIYHNWQKRDEEFQKQSLEFQKQSLEFQRQSRDFQERSQDFQEQSLDFQKESLSFQKESLELQKQSRHLLNLIWDHLASAPRDN